MQAAEKTRSVAVAARQSACLYIQMTCWLGFVKNKENGHKPFLYGYAEGCFQVNFSQTNQKIKRRNEKASEEFYPT